MRRIVCVVLSLILSHAAWAENCWMLGCKDNIGYIRLDPARSNQPLPFVGRSLPKIGQTVRLCEHAYLRREAIAQPMDAEEPERVAGDVLGPNTKVKILGYVHSGQNSEFTGAFASVRIIEDDSSCPSECSRCGGKVY